MNNGSSLSSMHPERLIALWHWPNTRFFYAESQQIDQVLSEWRRGCSGLVGPWGRWAKWPNSPQWPSTLLQVILRDSVKKMIIKSRSMVWLLLYHLSLTDRRDFFMRNRPLSHTMCRDHHGMGRKTGVSELLSLCSTTRVLVLKEARRASKASSKSQKF